MRAEHFSNGQLGVGARVRANGLAKSFGTTQVLQSIDLDVAPGEVVALLGPSGCGKTTLLRLFAGLLSPTTGQVLIGNDVVADAATGALVPPERRSIGMVFQDYALWPHMSIAANVAFPLEMRKVGAEDRRRRVAAALDLVGLGALGERAPGTLSGGQQQRVALARAVVSQPSVVLFDEPLSNLDRELRDQLVVDIAALVRSLGLTSVYVTHDHAEAFAMADRVAIMSEGRIVQIAPPEELVANPVSVEVANFLKLGLVLRSERKGKTFRVNGSGEDLALPDAVAGGDGPGHLLVPRHALSLTSRENGAISGHAIRSMFRGSDYATRVRLASGIDADIASAERISDGAPVGVAFAWDEVKWFADSSSSSL